MGKDYYRTLGLNRGATEDDVKKAYRKLALKYHPEKNKAAEAEQLFDEIAEAYDVLSDAEHRAIFDQYGEEGLKNGVPIGPNGEFTGAYTFHGNAHQIFKEFFGGNNPFADFFPADKGFGFGFGGTSDHNGLGGRNRAQQDAPIEKDLFLTLEELFHGCTKKMKISRRVMNDDGHSTSVKDKVLTINVKRGWKPNTRVTFPKEGDQGPNNVPADIVFIVKEKPHAISAGGKRPRLSLQCAAAQGADGDRCGGADAGRPPPLHPH
eukprot:Opistho-2@24399